MPKPEHGPRLADHEVKTLRQWIEEGAKYARHWSFIPPVKADPPEVSDASWPRNEIDRFVLAAMLREGLIDRETAVAANLMLKLICAIFDKSHVKHTI